jgi:murein DD-endopeptidase MepM/ murein hydrolase activator NlpD
MLNIADKLKEQVDNMGTIIGGIKMRESSRNEDGRSYARSRLPSPIETKHIIRIWDNFGVIRNSPKGWYAHSGIDITAKEGTELYLPVPSLVKDIVYRKSGWGNRIYFEITEGPYKGYDYAFCHCLKINDIKIGKEIDTTDPIAWVGQTGNSTGPHLHLMIGTDLGFNGYALRSDETSTIGFSDPIGIFDFEGARWG